MNIKHIQRIKLQDVLVGIDCGTTTGLAVMKRATRDLILHTSDFWNTYDFIVEKFTPTQVGIFIESPQHIKPSFRRSKNIRKEKKIAQNVGGVKRETELLIEGIRRAGYLVAEVVPKKTKLTHEQFLTLTGYNKTKTTNQHCRDAAMLIYGL